MNGFHKVVRAVSGFTGFLYQDLLVSRFHQGLYIIWHIHECFQGNWSVAVRCGFCNSDAAADDGDDYDWGPPKAHKHFIGISLPYWASL